MDLLRVPKSLDQNRSCYFELPADVAEKDLIAYAVTYRHQFPKVFHSRIGHHFIFQLGSVTDRDKFLNRFEIGCMENGLIVKRLTYHSNL